MNKIECFSSKREVPVDDDADRRKKIEPARDDTEKRFQRRDLSKLVSLVFFLVICLLYETSKQNLINFYINF